MAQCINQREVVGIVPAGGMATRISPLPCSKELFPIGFREGQEGTRPMVVSQYLLEQYRTAGVEKTYILLRSGKWDIANYYGDGTMVGQRLAYLLLHQTPSVPYTIDQAYPFVKDATVIFGFPDIIVQQANVFQSLLQRLEERKADLVLGLFPVAEPHKWDMVYLSEGQTRVQQIIPKPGPVDARYSWTVAAWSPKFTAFLHTYLASIKDHTSGSELSLGEVMQASINAGLVVESVVFEKGTCLDIGTPEDLQRAVQQYSGTP
ncbi:nucleotidyltransferase family protein [Pontibacter ruber]|uniref:glucose-1-phosphate thymidylyltransferase n=1 Tax=Pontibacter ruber TaxID=1343895 RepID=A0ABW5CT01_9BACT|nr:sugar phosphate nucleotidyltransferase [Pontibacter ruber]